MKADFLRFRLAVLLTAIGLTLGACANFPWSGLGTEELAAYPGKVDLNAACAIISKYRAAHGLTRVVIDPQLDGVAQTQALAMARANKLSHTVNGTLMTRLDDAGVSNMAAIENVSGGYHTLAGAIAGWRHSPEHNANLLNPRMRRMGIASATAPRSKYKIYWSLVMTD